MSQFDPKIQVRASHVAHSILQVDVPSYALREQLQVSLGIQLNWRDAGQPDHYVIIGTLQVRGHTPDGSNAFLAEATMHQVSEVTGFDDAELAEVLAVRLPGILLPYLRAQLASMLVAAGYHHVTLPASLNHDGLRATELALPIPAEVATAEEESTP